MGWLRRSGYVLSLSSSASRPLTWTLATATLLAGVLPAAAAWVGKLLVDAVVAAQAGEAAPQEVIALVLLEAVLVVALLGAQRGMGTARTLLGARLGDRVRSLVLAKALTLRLEDFEDPATHDRLSRIRRSAGSRPLSLLNRHFDIAKHAITLVACGALVLDLGAWALLLVVAAGVPAFLCELRYSREAYRVAVERTKQRREQGYLENVLGREDYAKEVKLLGLGPELFERFETIADDVYRSERGVTVRRGAWGFAFSTIGTGAFYLAYGWVVLQAAYGHIGLGAMTMYLVVFRQCQSAVTAALSTLGVMFEDRLYLDDLHDFLYAEVPTETGSATQGAAPDDGVRFEGVSFTYPGATRPALDSVSFRLRPGELVALVGDNGSGKTTLIKLLTRLYEADTGRITVDGTDVREWDVHALRERIGVIFQDFAKYKLSVGDNVGFGDVEHRTDQDKLRAATASGMAEFVDDLPNGLDTRLGRAFEGGVGLSGGQWQKIALSRVFMRDGADLLVLDEPTAAIDADAEARIFEHVRMHARGKMVLLISHRFSTVRVADRIVVLERGRVVEQGDHASLLRDGGRYAELYEVQAEGYREPSPSDPPPVVH